MARVKIEITLSNGDQSIIEKEIAGNSLPTFDNIDTLVEFLWGASCYYFGLVSPK